MPVSRRTLDEREAAKAVVSPFAASLAEVMQDQGTSQYVTTANHCTCPDHRYRHRVCKHMLHMRESEATTPVTEGQDEDARRVEAMRKFFGGE